METECMAFLQICLQLQAHGLPVLLYALHNRHRAQKGLFLAVTLALIAFCIS